MFFQINDFDHFHMMDWWFDLFGPFSWIFMILGWVIYISLSVILAYYVHKDAIKRGIYNSEFWLLIVLLFNIIGAILYLIVRPNYEGIRGTPIKNQ